MEHTVGDMMTAEPIVIDAQADLEEAEALMEEHAVRRLPVLNENNKLVGILSWGDVREATAAEAAVTNPYAPDAEEDWLTVEEAMTEDPVVVTPDTCLPDAVALMLNHKIGALPVVAAIKGSGQRQVVGIVTESDIFRLLLRIWREQDEA